MLNIRKLFPQPLKAQPSPLYFNDCVWLCRLLALAQFAICLASLGFIATLCIQDVTTGWLIPMFEVSVGVLCGAAAVLSLRLCRLPFTTGASDDDWSSAEMRIILVGILQYGQVVAGGFVLKNILEPAKIVGSEEYIRMKAAPWVASALTLLIVLEALALVFAAYVLVLKHGSSIIHQQGNRRMLFNQ